MLPEQVFDGNPPPGQSAGDGTRSATPLAWSHAEYIRLLRSKMDGQIADTPKVVADRYEGCVTTFRVKFDAGLGNSISIRGSQSPLSWQSGQLAH